MKSNPAEPFSKPETGSWKLVALALCLCVSVVGVAQNFVTVSATNVQNAFGQKLSAGQVCFQAVNSTGQPIGFLAGGGGQVINRAVCGPVTNGAFSVSVPNTALTAPANVCFHVTVKDSSTNQLVLGSAPSGQPSGYDCLQPAASNGWCSSGSCNFDNYTPNLAPLVAVQTGPTGPQGAVGAMGPAGPAAWSAVTAWTASTAYTIGPPASVVTYNGATYVCSTSHTSGSSFDASKWTQLVTSFPGSTPGAWIGPFTFYRAFGDSITSGTGASVAANAYANLIGSDTGLETLNLGASGTQGCDTTTTVFTSENPGNSGNPLYTLMISTNDANVKGAGSYEAVFNLCHQAAVSWLATPSSRKVTGDSFSTIPNNWTLDTYYQVHGLKSTTNGATATWAISTASANQVVYLWYRLIDGNGGTFTYALDGGSAVTLNNYTTPAIATQNGGTIGVGVARITVPAAGSHSIVTTVTSTTGSGNVVSVLAVGTKPSASYHDAPAVWVGGTPYQLNNADSAATAAYNTDIQNNVNLLAGDGLNVTFVNVQAYNGGTSSEMSDTLHPNDLGHKELSQGFEAAIKAVPSPLADPTIRGVTWNPTLPYTLLLTDQIVFFSSSSAGNVTLPPLAPVGKTYTLVNVGTGTIAVAGGIGAAGSFNLPGGTSAVLSNWGWSGPSTGLQWGFVVNPASSTNLGYTLASGSYTLKITDSMVFMNAGTLTLPNLSVSKAYFVINYSPTTKTTISNGGAENVPTSIPPLSGLIFTSAGGGTWYAAATALPFSANIPLVFEENVGPVNYTFNGADQIVYTAGGGTITLTSQPAGTTFYLLNYGSSPETISGAGGGTGNTILQPNQGMLLTTSGSNTWWIMAQSGTITPPGMLDQNGLTADLPSTTLYAVPAGQNGLYRVTCEVVLHQAAGTSSTLPPCTVSYTSQDLGSGRTVTIGTAATGNTAGFDNATGGDSTTISVQASSTIYVSTSGYASSGSPAMNFNLHARAEWLH